jgi:hypothetical protein
MDKQAAESIGAFALLFIIAPLIGDGAAGLLYGAGALPDAPKPA